MSKEFVIRNGAIIGNVSNSTSTQNIITISSDGLIEYRTPSEILSDIGGQSSGNYVTLDTTQIITGNKTFNSSIVINEDGANRDFRVEGDTDQNLLFTDASVDRIGIGTSTPSQKLDIDGSLRVRSISNGIGNFVTKNVDGVLTERTAAQVLSDIGAQGTITNPVTGTGTTNYVSKWSSSSEQTDSQIFDNGTNVGINITTPTDTLDVNGTLRVRDISNGIGNFITKDSNGVLTERTATQVLSDINAVPSSRTITSGTWLTGGGDLSTNRTINLVPTVDTYLNDSQSNPRIFFGGTNELSSQVILRSAISNGQFQLRDASGVLNWAINFGSGILEVGTVPWARLSNVPNFVPETRTLTINGISLDLSADRTWNVGTVTSVTTNNGITGTITSTGTLGLTGQALSLHNLSTNGIITRTGTGTVSSRTLTAGTGISITNGDGVNGNPLISSTITNPVTGTGTTNYVSKWSSSSEQTDSQIFDNGSRVGIGTTPTEKLDIDGTLRVRDISNGIGNFVTKNVDGVLTERTAAQVLSDIGAQGTITNPVTGTGTTNYVSKWSSSSEQKDSQIFDNGTNVVIAFTDFNQSVGIGTTSPDTKLDVNGDVTITDKIIHKGDTDTFIRFSNNDEINLDAGAQNQVKITSDGSGRVEIQRQLHAGDYENIIGTGYELHDGISSIIDTNEFAEQKILYVSGDILSNQNPGDIIEKGMLIALGPNGSWIPASATSKVGRVDRFLGIALNDVNSPSDMLDVLIDGIINYNENAPYHVQLTPGAEAGAPIYASTTKGAVTEVAPSSAGNIVKVLGHNIRGASMEIIVRFQPDKGWIEL